MYVMNKMIGLIVFAACLGGPAGAATIVHASSATTGVTRNAVSNLPDQLDKLQSEVKALRGQVSTLQNISMAQNGESAATLATIGVGG
jgi:hypothetical protein